MHIPLMEITINYLENPRRIKYYTLNGDLRITYLLICPQTWNSKA